MHKRKVEKVVISRPSPILHPPPVLPPEGSACLPPHRRLRSLFCRSRAVLPANTHPTEASDTQTFTDIRTRSHRAVVGPLGCRDAHSEDIQSRTDAFQPKTGSVLHRGAGFGSQAFADTWSLVSESPQMHLLSDRSRNRGRWVTPLQTSEGPAIKDKQRRRQRSLKVDCSGKYVLPSLKQKEEDVRLGEWLQSLGIAGDSVTSNNQQKSRFRGVTKEQEPSYRRDRRPHFLPPLLQSDSLLHVPFFLPENSPPPSPFTHRDPPMHPLSMRRRGDAVGQPKGGDL
ncbi:hypothetical protein PBY51_008312 [Eleginops maclovinus]|uniref:Uncharacterized protein n=1 Tax=Eleginops maclovinus TaxID=56733 RepID=A0AAN8ABP9_ELEMC|nr:hypothetical protein PBY51_008312 [Eleginops maclovinus]